MMSRSNHVMLVSAVTFAVMGSATTVVATRWDSDFDGLPAIAAGTRSFVRDSAGNIVSDDVDYAQAIEDAMSAGTWDSVDVLMQICFGGGFIDDFDSTVVSGDYSFTSAARWNGAAWNVDAVSGSPSTLDNFTRAWRESADGFSTDGMLTHFLTASYGAQADDSTADASSHVIQKSPHAVPSIKGAGLQEELPQYLSPDATIGGTNDARKLSDSDYALIIQWDAAVNTRHEVNLQRIRASLNSAGIADSNIVVLSPLGSGGSISMRTVDGESLASLSVTGTNDMTNWQDAISGNSAIWNATIAANSRLFVYNTGHGGQLLADCSDPGSPSCQTFFSHSSTDSGGPSPAQGPGGVQRHSIWTIPLDNHFETQVVGDPRLQSITADVNPMFLSRRSVTLHLAMAADQPFDAATTQLFVNGIPIDILAVLEEPRGARLFQHPFLVHPIEVFEVVLDFDLIRNAPGNELLIELVDPLLQMSPDASLLAGLSLRGGDQEMRLFIAPEPATVALVIGGIGVLLASRRRG